MQLALATAFAKGTPTRAEGTSLGNLAIAGLLMLHEAAGSTTPLLDSVVEFAAAAGAPSSLRVLPAAANVGSGDALRLHCAYADGTEREGQCTISYGRDAVLDVAVAKDASHAVVGSAKAPRPTRVWVTTAGDHRDRLTGGPVPQLVASADLVVLGCGSTVTSLLAAVCAAEDTLTAVRNRAQAKRRVVLVVNGSADAESTWAADAASFVAGVDAAIMGGPSGQSGTEGPRLRLITDVVILSGDGVGVAGADHPAPPPPQLSSWCRVHMCRASPRDASLYSGHALWRILRRIAVEASGDARSQTA
jgi:hypothetical protein